MITMARVTNPDPDAPQNPNTKNMRLPGGAKRYRDTFIDARSAPSVDPNNPYANNKYKIQKTTAIWEKIRPCRKDMYNHSFAKYHLSGAVDEKSNFITTDYILGMNDINHTLDPATGKWDAPECFCFTITDLLCNPLDLESYFYMHATNGGVITAYNTFHSGGDRVTGSWKNLSYVHAAGVKSPFHFERKTAMVNWLMSMDRRNKLPMIPGFNVHGPTGSHYLDNPNRWKIQRAEGGTYVASFCPFGCDSSLCGEGRNKFSISISDEVAVVDYTGPTEGVLYEARWFDEKLFDFYVGETMDSETKSGSVRGYGIHDKVPKMYLGNSLDCHDNTVKYPGRVLCNDDYVCFVDTDPVNKECIISTSSTFEFEDTPFTAGLLFGKLCPEIKVYARSIEHKKEQKGSSMYCVAPKPFNWWECGGLITSYRSAMSGEWYSTPYANNIDFKLTGPETCMDSPVNFFGLVDGIRFVVRNSPIYNVCMGTYIYKVEINDKLYGQEDHL